MVSVTLVAFLGFILLEQNRNANFKYNNFGVQVPIQGTILGIDVSHHQGEIDWDMALGMRIANDSIQFVYLKATEGSDFKDRHYDKNRRILDQKKVKVGAYHFFIPTSPVLDQVNFFSQIVAKTSLKPVLDVEISKGASKEACVDSVTKFLNLYTAMKGVRPIIYTNESFYNDVFKNSSLKTELFWIANFKTIPKSFVNSNTLLWQFSEKGTINGIREKVDLNKAKFNFFELAKW
ncbi:hypothetical protein DNU06_09550 [Putridiphycobacter roseus]|uniref:Lysozyme n=2 Tax=Putridiphycobacter roseus TaxID=2219161 RepID=A0A2W1NCA4_9FLAO|nr:hypothetical protein DNU06_09550 [Putridiphycobacter roseus]